jgi:hypothetical protein
MAKRSLRLSNELNVHEVVRLQSLASQRNHWRKCHAFKARLSSWVHCMLCILYIHYLKDPDEDVTATFKSLIGLQCTIYAYIWSISNAFLNTSGCTMLNRQNIYLALNTIRTLQIENFKNALCIAEHLKNFLNNLKRKSILLSLLKCWRTEP